MTFWEAVIHLQCGRQIKYKDNSHHQIYHYKLSPENQLLYGSPRWPYNDWYSSSRKISFIHTTPYTLVPLEEEI